MILQIALCSLIGACGLAENFSNTLALEVEGNELVMNGIINSRAPRAFADVLDENPQLSVVIFDQIEGSLDGDAVADMGYMLRDAGLATRMVSTSAVYSGGVDLFLAGVDRVVESGAIVGVHEWKTGVGAGRDYPRGAYQHEPTRGFIEDMLGSDAFYWFTLQAAPFDGVHEMTRGELVRFGVVTR